MNACENGSRIPIAQNTPPISLSTSPVTSPRPAGSPSLKQKLADFRGRTGSSPDLPVRHVVSPNGSMIMRNSVHNEESKESTRNEQIIENAICVDKIGSLIVNLLCHSCLFGKQKLNLDNEPPSVTSSGLITFCGALADKNARSFILYYLFAIRATLRAIEAYMPKSLFREIKLSRALELKTEDFEVDLFYKFWDRFMLEDLQNLKNELKKSQIDYKKILNVSRLSVVASVVSASKQISLLKIEDKIVTVFLTLFANILEFVFDQAIGIVILKKESDDAINISEIDGDVAKDKGREIRSENKKLAFENPYHRLSQLSSDLNLWRLKNKSPHDESDFANNLTFKLSCIATYNSDLYYRLNIGDMKIYFDALNGCAQYLLYSAEIDALFEDKK